nr:response regulator [Lachnospiraceae bacterium]
MSISRSLLAMMGSEISVESVYGEGSTFSFSLKQEVVKWNPIGDYKASHDEGVLPGKQYKASYTAPEAHILIVDDNPINNTVFAGLLKTTGIKIDTATNADSAIKDTYNNKYDLIFLDHMMPGKDGIQALHEIRSNADNPNQKTPAVCITANAIAEAREEYLAVGFDDYMTKPVDPDVLDGMILKYLPKTLVNMGAQIEEEISDENIPESVAGLRDYGIDINAGIRHSGSIDMYIDLLKIFHRAVDDNVKEISRLYEEKDYKNYTIKVHALKSSAKTIGALKFGEKAQRLEDAGKAQDIDYIQNKNEGFIKEYKAFKELLSGLNTDESGKADKPEADEYMISEALNSILIAAQDMNCDRLFDIFDELDGYSIPKDQTELFEKLRKASDNFDYSTIVELLEHSDS